MNVWVEGAVVNTRGIAMSRLFPIPAGVVFAVLLCAAADVQADEAKLKHELARLMEIGWQPSIKARAEAAEQFELVGRMAPIDGRVPYAYALVQVRQRKYPEAAKLVADVLAKDEKNVHAWRTKIWISMLTKDCATAMVEMDSLGKVLGEGDGGSVGEVDETKQELARFLGRMFGFLEGPGEGQAAAALVDSQQRKVFSRLTDPQQTAFTEARHAVAERYASLTGEQESTKDEAIKEQQRRKEALRDEVQRRRKQIAKELAFIEPERDRLEDELRTELDEVAKLERPLLSELSGLEARAVIVRREMSVFTSDIARLERLLERERDPVQRERLRRDIDRLASILTRYEADLLVLNRQARAIHARRVQLEARRRQAQAMYQRDTARIESKLTDLRRQSRRVDVDQKRIEKPTTGNTPRVRNIEREAKAFTTYEQLPVQAERQRLLDSFK